MRRLAVAFATVGLAVSVMGPGVASAATEVGSNCTGNRAESNYTFLNLQSGSGATTAAPAAGVVTQWKLNVVPIPPGVLSQSMRVFRSTGGNQFQVVAETPSQSLVGGLNTFASRIPVQAGDRFGLFGSPETLYCETGNLGDLMGYVPTNAGVGSNQAYLSAPGTQAPVIAVVEPDADNDGFGDETQDKCPQSAAFQVPCPIVTLDASPLAGKKSATVYVAVSADAPVSVIGTVNLGKGKKATLKAGPTFVPAGKIVSFRLKFSKALKDRLKELTPKQKLTLKVTASATNVVGLASTDKVNAKLKGQG